MTKVTEIPIDQIRTDGIGDSKVPLHEAKVQDYAKKIIEGNVFPPVTVYDDGDHYWLADGFHRFEAVRRLGKSHFGVRLKRGSKENAVAHYQAHHQG